MFFFAETAKKAVELQIFAHISLQATSYILARRHKFTETLHIAQAAKELFNKLPRNSGINVTYIKNFLYLCSDIRLFLNVYSTFSKIQLFLQEKLILIHLMFCWTEACNGGL